MIRIHFIFFFISLLNGCHTTTNTKDFYNRDDCRNLRQLGRINIVFKNYDKAEIVLNKALSISKEWGDEQTALCYSDMFTLYYMKGDYNKARKCYTKSIKIMSENQPEEYIKIFKKRIKSGL